MDAREECSALENDQSEVNNSDSLTSAASSPSESLDLRLSKIEIVISRLANEMSILKDNFENIVIQSNNCRRKIKNVNYFKRKTRKKLQELERKFHYTSRLSSSCCEKDNECQFPYGDSSKNRCFSNNLENDVNTDLQDTSPGDSSVNETCAGEPSHIQSGKSTVPFETFIIRDCDGCELNGFDHEENTVTSHLSNNESEENSANQNSCTISGLKLTVLSSSQLLSSCNKTKNGLQTLVSSGTNSSGSSTETNGETCTSDVMDNSFLRLQHNFDGKHDSQSDDALLKEDISFKYGCSANPIFSPHGNELDTFDIARRVRELLSVHNIGQRIFAKYVLGLSQGTVSELLSKPKPWMKLTEKGRDSYRKMWHWANSSEGIMALKSLSPRRGFKDSHYYKSVKEDPEVEEKIVQILSDAQRQMQIAKDCTNDSPSVFLLKNENPQESTCSKVCSNSESYHYLLKNNSDAGETTKNSNNANKTATEIPLDLSVKLECRHCDEDTCNKNDPALCNGNIVREGTLQSSSPLHHIQTITDNLSNGSSNFNHLNVKPLKAVLPPISQAHIELFSFIDTEELVKEIKDFLGKYCVSQRQFGEVVLGLSQGSVSDLLARPKSWSALTQKGREPFIRMKLFLTDPNNYQRLFKTNKTYSEMKRNSGKSFTVKHEPFVEEDSMKMETFDDYAAEDLAEYAGSRDSSEDAEMRSPISLPSYSLPQCAIPAELDTEVISSRVKELLTISNIGQRIFGEAVLNLSQGTVSELLSKPKSWYALSVKGREPYARMYSWLQDPQNVEKLTEWKIEKELIDKNYPYAVLELQRQKRRFVFNDEQRSALKSVFDNVPYPNMATVEALAKSLNLQTNKIINWFHNQRMRMKQKNANLEGQKDDASSSSESKVFVDISSACNRTEMTPHSAAKEQMKCDNDCHSVSDCSVGNNFECSMSGDAACTMDESNCSKKRLCKYDSLSSNKRRKSVPQKRLYYCGSENYMNMLKKMTNNRNYLDIQPIKEENLDFYNINHQPHDYTNTQTESIVSSDNHCLTTAIKNCITK